MEDFLSFVERNKDKIPEELYSRIMCPHETEDVVIYGPKSTLFFKGSSLHREDGPAKVLYNESGKVESEEWYTNGVLHREGGPARVRYHESGQVWIEEWYSKEDFPAIMYVAFPDSDQCSNRRM